MKKKLAALLFFTAMICGIWSVTVSAAEGVCGDDLTWTLDGGTLTISGTGKMYDYSAVSEPDKGPWLESGEEVKNVVIENGVESVGMRAFHECKTLESVVLADSVTEIGGAAFYYCGDSFTSITIPANVNSIEQSALSGNPNLTVYGYSGTYAETFAVQKGISFESLGEAPSETINVSNSTELLEAIGSNREIILADGVYTLDNALEIGTYSAGVQALTIKAENPGKAEILSKDGYEPVVKIYSSEDIEFDGLILGHETISYEDGCGSGEYSSGYVVQAYSSNNVTVKNCDLYGCGTIAIVVTGTDNFTAENCIMRDCKESIANISGENLQIKNCIISGNAYDPKFAASKPAVEAFYYPATFTNCAFYNNYSTEFSNNDDINAYVVTEECVFQDNAWQDGKTPKAYGVCLNGITWQITDGVLRLGYPLEFEDGTAVESATGEVLPYSIYSMPWRGKTYASVDTALGVIYDSSLTGPCGENAKWSLSEGVLTISGTGEMGTSYGFNNQPWYDYRDQITEVCVEEGITKVGNGAFTEFKALETATLPESLIEIGSNAFTGCENIKRIVVPGNVEKIGTAVFSDCSALEEIVLPDSVSIMETQAIAFCPALKEITLPKSLESVTGELFRGDTGLQAINISEDSEYFTSVNGVLFNKDMTELIAYPPGLETGFYAVPDGVTKIGTWAFNECIINEIVISDTVTELGDRAFAWVNGEKITVPESVETIGAEAFTASQNMTIYVYQDSAAHSYVMNNYINFALMPEIYSVDVRGTNGTIMVTVDAANAENGTIFAVGMSGGEVTDVSEIKDGTAVLEGGADTVKVFCWDSLESMRPICPAIVKQ